MTGRKPPRPSWALAYVLTDWRKHQVVRKAYNLATADDDYEDLAKRPTDEVFAAVKDSRERLAGYVRALDSVLADWEIA